jgi:hypothetical protein
MTIDYGKRADPEPYDEASGYGKTYGVCQAKEHERCERREDTHRYDGAETIRGIKAVMRHGLCSLKRLHRQYERPDQQKKEAGYSGQTDGQRDIK